MAMRVVLTGAGVVSCLGNDVETFWQRLYAGESGLARCADPRMPYVVGRADIDPAQLFSRLQLNALDRVSVLAVAAATQTVRSAGLQEGGTELARAGVFTGTGLGGAATIEESYANFFEVHGPRKKKVSVPVGMTHAPASQVAMRLGARGECQTYSTACSSSAVAIGEAVRRIRHGYADLAVAGGAEALLVPGILDTWSNMRVLCDAPGEEAPSACRPFSADRNGFALSEGAAFLVLESLASAEARGAQPWCEVVGYGVSNDATHITKPDGAGQARAMAMALAEAGIAPTAVGHVNAHGTATEVGDAVETQSIRLVFGEHAPALAISATKSSHGHVMGATAAVECLATAMALRRQAVPPTAHWRSRDSACDLDYVPRHGRPAADLAYAMSNSFAFGGNNAVLLLRRWQ